MTTVAREREETACLFLPPSLPHVELTHENARTCLTFRAKQNMATATSVSPKYICSTVSSSPPPIFRMRGGQGRKQSQIFPGTACFPMSVSPQPGSARLDFWKASRNFPPSALQEVWNASPSTLVFAFKELIKIPGYSKSFHQHNDLDIFITSWLVFSLGDQVDQLQIPFAKYTTTSVLFKLCSTSVMLVQNGKTHNLEQRQEFTASFLS